MARVDAFVGFEKLSISSTSYANDDLLHISKMIKLLGGTYEQYLTPNIEVLISASRTPNIDKLRFARENKIPVVLESWIWSCIEAGESLAVDQFLVVKTAETQQPPTYQTTDTMTLPSAVVGKSHHERYVFLGESKYGWHSYLIDIRSQRKAIQKHSLRNPARIPRHLIRLRLIRTSTKMTLSGLPQCHSLYGKCRLRN
jgi:BRCA1 C Terminus (BRCT) domain